MTASDTIAKEMADTYEEFEECKRVHAENQADFARLKAKLARLHDALSDARATEIHVSDHALVRYAERVLGWNSDEAKARIMAQVAPLAFVLGDGKYPVDGQAVAVVENRVIKTILPL